MGLLAMVLCSAVACASPQEQPRGATSPAPQAAVETTAGPITITARDVPAPVPATVTVPATAPDRIVSLATGVGETLAALGVGDRVVGRDETSEAPTIDTAPVLTKAHAVSAERVLATAPDVVLVDASTSPAEAVDQIRAAGVTVVEIPEAWTLQDIAPRTRAVAQAVGVPAEVADTVATTATGIAPTARTSGDRPRVAFLYLRGTSAIYLLGGEGSGADALIDAAGGTDVGAEAGLGAFVPLTAEALAAANPDVLLVMTGGLDSVGGVDALADLPGVAQTRAGRDRRIISVEDTLLLSFGPRTGALVDQLATTLTELGP